MENSPAAESKDLFLLGTCLCDAFFDDVAVASVEILEFLGCRLRVPPDQTCCGQPAFNAGDWPSARRVLRQTESVFSGDQPIVVPSASCAAMLRHGSRLAFEKEGDLLAVKELGARSWEICDYIVSRLGVSQWQGRYDGRVVLHRSCHTRGTGSAGAALQLLRSIEGLQLREPEEADQCCGFGGTFAASFPFVSTAMGRRKLDALAAPEPERVVSTDMGCLLHLQGLAEKVGRRIQAVHVAQLLRDALRNSGHLR